MNRDNVQLLIDTIKSQKHTSFYDEDGFNMGTYLHSCGTASCIAGYAHKLADYSFPIGTAHGAMRWLDIDQDKALNLFNAIRKNKSANSGKYQIYDQLERITPTEAVKALRNVLGGVDKDHIWDHLLNRWIAWDH